MKWDAAAQGPAVQRGLCRDRTWLLVLWPPVEVGVHCSYCWEIGEMPPYLEARDLVIILVFFLS